MTILFVDDELHLRNVVKQTFELAELPLRSFDSPQAVLPFLSREFPGILISDLRMPGMDGMQLMERALDVDPALPVVLITGHGDVQQAVEAIRKGAYDFIEKPFATTQLVEVAKRALEKRALTLENRRLRSAASGRDTLEVRITGRAPAILALREQVRALASSDVDVLIVGETGSGKEVVARALHTCSPRAHQPFMAINCAAIPETLLESELFGYVAGAFAGANDDRPGKFASAAGGTIFLDEIESMPETLQVKLLRVIEDRAITPLGSNQPIPLNARFVAASKQELEALAQQGKFRKDLLYRLNVATVRVPALRQRSEDIPRLFTQLVNEACLRYRRPFPQIPEQVLLKVTMQDWPGNVRELRNAADRFALGLGDPDQGQASTTGADRYAKDDTSLTLAERVQAFERQALIAALAAHGGRLKETYEALGLSRKTLYEKMQKYNLERDSFIK